MPVFSSCVAATEATTATTPPPDAMTPRIAASWSSAWPACRADMSVKRCLARSHSTSTPSIAPQTMLPAAAQRAAAAAGCGTKAAASQGEAAATIDARRTPEAQVMRRSERSRRALPTASAPCMSRATWNDNPRPPADMARPATAPVPMIAP